jgi:4-hydroxy-3-polyprenylbenzoate decarboxylase
MSQAADAGAIIFPPIPAFYHQPKSINELVDATVGRMLARIGITNDLVKSWGDSAD